MADPTQPPAPKTADDPGYVQRLINQLRQWNPIKANPTDPNDPTGAGGAARGNAIDKAVAEAGG